MDTRLRIIAGLRAAGAAGLLFLLLVFPAISPMVAAANPTSGDRIALKLRKNVVRITAGLETGTVQKGFGFIVGQRGEDLYLATANHVVRSGLPGEDTLEISVQFFGDPGRSHQGELMETYYPSPQDLAVIRVRKPDGLAWETRAMVPPARLRSGVRGTEVWFVGRGGNWYVPTVPGRINSDQPDLNSILFVDINTVMPGTSGAPLISGSGIMGMIVQDEAGGVARVVSIEAIRQAFTEWRYPWNLAVTVDGEPETVVTVDKEPEPEIIAPPTIKPKSNPPAETKAIHTQQKTVAPPKIKNAIAIFPLLLQGDASQFSLIFKRILKESIVESGLYDNILECFLGANHPGSNGQIRFDRSLVEQIWVKEGWLSETEPSVATIQRLGRELGVKTVLLFSATVGKGRDPMRFYLMDVSDGKILKKQDFTDWIINDFEDTILEAGFETKAMARAALEDYRKVNH